MKKLIGVLLCAVLVASAISPWIYWGMQELIARGIFTALEGFPFHRYWSRVTQVTTIIFALPILFSLGVRKMSDLALVRNPYRWRDLLLGILLTMLVATALCGIYFALKIVVPQPSIEWEVLTKIALTACVVAVLEEVIFRGVLLGLALRIWGGWKSAIAVSILFAAVHFLKPAKSPTESVSWHSGFDQLGAIFMHLPPWDLLAYGFSTLFFAGLLLAWARLLTGSLWLAIGIHGGWIFAQQTFNLVAREAAVSLPWAGPSLVSGIVPTGILPLAALAIIFIVAGQLRRVWRR